MKFFQSAAGRYYPVDMIESFSEGGRLRDGTEVPPRVLLRERGFDDPSVEITDSTLESLIQSGQKHFAAQPGYYLLRRHGSGENVFIEKQPIIGWRVDYYGGLQPLIVEQDNSALTGNGVILYPDGTAMDLFGTVFDDQAAWEKECNDTEKAA